jgi:hypothetical protein
MSAAIAGATVYFAKGVEANNWLIESDTRLATIARTVADATEVQTNELRKLSDETEKRTAIEAEAVKMGQSQLLSFGMSVESTKKLTASMADLGAAQLGNNIEGRDLIDIANLLGKAYMGQAGALTRAGIILDENQKKLLQTGNESERVAALTKIIEQNYGGLAEAMRNTPQGAMKMLEHDLGTLQETLTAGFLPVIGEVATTISEMINTSELSKDTSVALEMAKTLGVGLAELGKVAVNTATSFDFLGTMLAKSMTEAAATFEENRGFLHQLMGTGISQEAIRQQEELGKIRATSLRASADEMGAELTTIAGKNQAQIDTIQRGIDRIKSLTKDDINQGATKKATGKGSETGARDGGGIKNEAFDQFAYIRENIGLIPDIDEVLEEKARSYSAILRKRYDDEAEQARLAAAESKRLLEEQALEQAEARQATIQSAIDTAQTLINIGNMVADAAVARDQKELDSWRTKEQEKIDVLNISANRKRQLEKKLAEETIQREKDIAKRRGRIEIASTMANAASSIAQVYANMLASGAKFGVPGLLAAKIAAVTAAAGIMATATAQTAIIASQMNGYASGGMVGGRNARSTRGADDQVATVRTGEMVLNASQQKRLYDTIYNGAGGGGINITIGELTGDKLQELEDMLLKLKSYGRI